MKLHSYGRTAVLVELDSPDDALTLRARLEQTPPTGAIETMSGLQTVLIRFDPALTDQGRLADVVRGIDLSPDREDGTDVADEVSVRIEYGGEDLADVAAHCGLSESAVVEAHLACRYRVVLIGMAPGFYFLAGGDPHLVTPRRRSPRTTVPRGAVGLAGQFTGIYPRRGPGGWQLIGRVVDDLWHPTRMPAALLPVGTGVRFTAA